MLSNKDSLTSLQTAFVYSSPDEQEDDVYTGSMASYSGGGYSANLGSSLDEAQALLQGLENNRWIDMYTRAVFVEFNIFNPGSGLANLVLLLLELPTNGDTVWSCRMEIVQLYRYSGEAVKHVQLVLLFAYSCPVAVSKYKAV